MLLGIGIAAAIFAWAFVGLAGLDLLPGDMGKWIDNPMNKVKKWLDEPWEIAFYGLLAVSLATVGFLYATGSVGVLVIAGGASAFVLGIVGLYAPQGTRIREIAPELVGIAIGVMAIDQLYQIRAEQEQKIAIVRQIRSQSNDFALEGVRLAREKGMHLDGSLKETFFAHANLEGAFLAEANLEGAYLEGANLEGANLRYAHLEGAFLMEANLGGAFLESSNLEGANLFLTQLEGANLSGAYLEGALLLGSNLEGAFLEGIHLEGAVYDNHTKWPDGFDPESVGAINWDALTEEQQNEWWTKYYSDG